jgi:hypothetical protein
MYSLTVRQGQQGLWGESASRSTSGVSLGIGGLGDTSFQLPLSSHGLVRIAAVKSKAHSRKG